MIRLLALTLVLFLPLSAAEKLRVLMIGNSYTAQTRSEVKGFLDADPEVEVEMVVHCPGGRKLVQHVESSRVAELLEDKEGWDVVVIQEQSQLPAFAMLSKGEAYDLFTQNGVELIRRVRKAQPEARILLFETWARHRDPDRAGTLKHFDGKPERMQDALTRAYAMLRSNPGEWDFSKEVAIVPVGRAWQRWYERKGYDDEGTKLHSRDHSHPGKLGAYLTGAVFYESLTGRKAGELPYQGRIEDPDLAEELREQASTPR